MNLQSLTPEAGGEIRVGDILIGVGNEDVSKMPLSRGKDVGCIIDNHDV